MARQVLAKGITRLRTEAVLSKKHCKSRRIAERGDRRRRAARGEGRAHDCNLRAGGSRTELLIADRNT